MGLYRLFISLLLVSTLSLSFIYILQVREVDIYVRQLDTVNRSLDQTEHLPNSGQDVDIRDVTTARRDHEMPVNTRCDPGLADSPRVKFTELASGLYVYGVYLDERYRPSYYLRVLVLQRGHHNTTLRLACGTESTVFSTWAEAYEMCENHGKTYGGWIYSCLVPRSTELSFRTVVLTAYSHEGSVVSNKNFTLSLLRPDTLSEATKEFSKKISNYMSGSKLTKINPVNNVPESLSGAYYTPLPRNISIAVCVPPLHGNVNLQSLIEFLELSWILGADKVFLYVYDLPRDLVSTLEQLLAPRSRRYELVYWDLPEGVKSKPYQVIWNHGQLLAVQHCLYHHMATFDWMLFLDIDEMLIPRTLDTWPELLRAVLKDSASRTAALSLESAFFSQTYAPDGSGGNKYFQNVHRTKRTSVLHSKPFLQTKLVFEAGIHHLSRAISDRASVLRVPADTALLHHYRPCLWRESVHCNLVVEDTTALKFQRRMKVFNDWLQSNG